MIAVPGFSESNDGRSVHIDTDGVLSLVNMVADTVGMKGAKKCVTINTASKADRTTTRCAALSFLMCHGALSVGWRRFASQSFNIKRKGGVGRATSQVFVGLLHCRNSRLTCALHRDQGESCPNSLVTECRQFSAYSHA